MFVTVMALEYAVLVSQCSQYGHFLKPTDSSYKQERDCLMHFARRANTLLEDEESARDSHALACNFATYLLI